MKSMDRGRATALAMAAVISLGAAQPITDDLLTSPGVAFETYLSRWWGAPGSEMTRPIYRIARFDTGAFQLHYGIVPGRDLSDYTMPYWPIRSFLSWVDAPVEIAQQVRLTYRDPSGPHAIGFTPRSGVELAEHGNALHVKIRNRSIAKPEDVTTAVGERYEETDPLSLEEVFVLRKGERSVPVRCSLSNVSDVSLREVTLVLVYEQSFGWGRFGVAEDDVYLPVRPPASGKGRSFYAFSKGMGRGYAFTAGEGTTLTYELAREMNRWRVSLSHAAAEVPSATAEHFGYTLRVLDALPERVETCAPQDRVLDLDYVLVQPTSFKTAPVQPARRVRIDDILAKLDRPKVRGLNLRAGSPQAFDDLETLRDWGCNLVITGLGDPEQTAELIARGHSLGMEMLLTGRGSYREGAPQFDSYYATPRTSEQIPDAHGQDEDHYYWHAIKPVRTFAAEFGKPMAEATQDEKVAYWAHCFADKWRGVQDAVRPYAPNAGVWFYAPFPSVAHVDPVDDYDLFMRTLTRTLGDVLTVFPFYYGIEYNQAEYMMRRWKDAGAARAVFLPMRDFMTKPSQFIRAITAARRGAADGTTGFNFAISDAPPDQQWQWRTVMLGAWANFPTPDLDAFCLIEEPAELIEVLAERELMVRLVLEAGDFDGNGYMSPLFKLLPGARPASDPPQADELTIIITNRPSPDASDPPITVPSAVWDAHKGVVHMRGRTLVLSGADTTALRHACDLLLRFADVARDENRSMR
jgi:hypothetical protein